jgi:hypothetical protein
VVGGSNPSGRAVLHFLNQQLCADTELQRTDVNRALAKRTSDPKDRRASLVPAPEFLALRARDYRAISESHAATSIGWD